MSVYDSAPLQIVMAVNNQSGNLDIATFKELSAGAGTDIFKINSEGVFAGAVTFADAPFQLTFQGAVVGSKFTIKTSDGTVLLDTTSESGDFLQVINTALDTAEKQILGEFTFGESGAITIKSDDDNGIWISPTGILSKYLGVTKMSLPISGNPTFGGELIAPSGTLGTITAGTIQTNTTGYYIKMNGTSNKFEALNGSTVLGSIYPSASGDLILNGTDDVNLAINDTIKCGAYSGAFKPQASGYDLGADSSANRWDNIYGNNLHIESNGHISGALTVGTVQGDHKSSDGTSGTSTSEDLVTSVWYDSGAEKLKYNYRSFTWKDGLLTSKGSEQTATAWTL